ncbi:hypothetical protein D3C73_1499690 [compost metagenome]
MIKGDLRLFGSGCLNSSLLLFKKGSCQINVILQCEGSISLIAFLTDFAAQPLQLCARRIHLGLVCSRIEQKGIEEL